MRDRRFLNCFAGATLAWILGIILGLAILIVPITGPSEHSTANHTSVTIFLANVRVLAGCFLGLVTGSAASLVTLMLNGIYIGISWNALTNRASSWEVISFLAPHGLLEVPGLLLAGAVGMMGCTIARAIYLGDPVEIRWICRPLVLAIPASVALILMAAFVESWSISRL